MWHVSQTGQGGLCVWYSLVLARVSIVCSMGPGSAGASGAYGTVVEWMLYAAYVPDQVECLPHVEHIPG